MIIILFAKKLKIFDGIADHYLLFYCYKKIIQEYGQKLLLNKKSICLEVEWNFLPKTGTSGLHTLFSDISFGQLLQINIAAGQRRIVGEGKTLASNQLLAVVFNRDDYLFLVFRSHSRRLAVYFCPMLHNYKVCITDMLVITLVQSHYLHSIGKCWRTTGD